MTTKTKRILIAITLCIVLLLGTAFAQSGVRVYVNGMRVNESVIMSNDRTYLPVRAVTEALGADVVWDEETQSVFITFTEDDMIAKVVEQVSPSVVTIVGNQASSSVVDSYNNPTVHGSGVIYKSNGHIVTNAHVVKDLKNLTVVLSDGTMLPGKVLYSDDVADLAVVKVDKVGLTSITMGKMETVVAGKTALAIGTPVSLSMRNTVTKGIVCAAEVALPDSHYKLIQTDATVNPGNSGGPLLNTKGELIGINSSKYVSASIDNMAFAIPVDTVQYAISQFEANGKINRPELDITLENSWEAKIGLPTTKGVTVKKSGLSTLCPGDVIERVNGIQVHSVADWNEAVKKTYTGSLQIVYTRDGVQQEVTI